MQEYGFEEDRDWRFRLRSGDEVTIDSRVAVVIANIEWVGEIAIIVTTSGKRMEVQKREIG